MSDISVTRITLKVTTKILQLITPYKINTVQSYCTQCGLFSTKRNALCLAWIKNYIPCAAIFYTHIN